MISSGAVSFSETMRLPTTCFTEDQCTKLGTQLPAEAGVTNGHCDYDAATGCSCSVTYSTSSMGSGTYQVRGNNVTFSSDAAPNAEPEDYGFCVSGNTASFHHDSASGLSATLILTK